MREWTRVGRMPTVSGPPEQIRGYRVSRQASVRGTEGGFMKPVCCMRYRVGDVFTLKRSLPIARAGEYVLLSVDDVVRLARVRRTRAGRAPSRKYVYLMAGDLGVFSPTRECCSVPARHRPHRCASVVAGRCLRSRTALCHTDRSPLWPSSRAHDIGTLDG